MKNPGLMSGVSFLEILIAFGILSIMLGVTLPDPEHYLVRAKVERSLEIASGARSALQNTCILDRRAVVKTHQDAGFAYTPPKEQEDYVAQLLLEADCSRDEMTVIVRTRNTGAETDPVLKLTASAVAAAIPGGEQTDYAWKCALIAGESRHAPVGCRDQKSNG